MIKVMKFWPTRIMEGAIKEVRPGWNDELVKAAAAYRERNYSRNANGMLMRNPGCSENLLQSMDEGLRAEFGQFLKLALALYIEQCWGGNMNDISEPKFAASSAHTPNCEPSYPHTDHGCNVVIAYFAEAYLDEEKHPFAGTFVAIDDKFPSAFQMGGAASDPMMFRHTPKAGSFVVYTPDTVHLHSPTFNENSRRTVIDTFVNFNAANRLPRVAGAIALP